MTDSQLLKFARARDDFEFVARVAAAMTVQAQYQLEAHPDLSVPALALMNWVLDNPLQPLPIMTAYASTHPPIADKVTLTGGVVKTSDVLDDDIKYIVGVKWEVVATKMFG